MVHFLSAALAAVKTLERVCPECRHTQVVGPSQRGATVSCKKCGGRIPPKQQ